ncbi:DUF4160 domain-containing protein [Candidatus Venteria ishoeyi]|uniref:DUF4160 domain-containing protein n=1 Tax=Candidatus Venteria ishoeyi TaxID=1899563 RepID=A0A1H6F9G7_9GAMM|nr:Uncharacterised protein [Candidatus Venteria ishoeyi]
MPEISRFLGIVIYMYFNEYNPHHFHAEYNEYKASKIKGDASIFLENLRN